MKTDSMEQRETGSVDRRIQMLYIYDPSGIYCKVFPISPCDCPDLSELYQYSGRDIVKGTTSICCEILCWFWMRAGLASNLFGCMWISHYDEESNASANWLLFIKQVHYRTTCKPYAVCENTTVARGNNVFEQYASRELHTQSKEGRCGKMLLYSRNRQCSFSSGQLQMSLLVHVCWIRMMLQIYLQRMMIFTVPVTHPATWRTKVLQRNSVNRRKSYCWLQNHGWYLSWLNELSMGPAETRGKVCKAPKGILLPGTPCCFVTIHTSQPHDFLRRGKIR